MTIILKLGTPHLLRYNLERLAGQVVWARPVKGLTRDKIALQQVTCNAVDCDAIDCDVLDCALFGEQMETYHVSILRLSHHPG